MAVKIDRLKCIGCGACTYVCPVEALEVVDMKSMVDEEKCISCGQCVPACTWEAITLEEPPKKKGPAK
jgi:Fe-S-cluster-containing hydrogenase component 2